MTLKAGATGKCPQPQRSGLRRQRAKQPFGCPLHIVEGLTDIGRNSIVHHLGDLSGQNQTTGSQAGEMLGRRGLGEPDPEGNLTGLAFAVPELIKDRQTDGTGQQTMQRRFPDRIGAVAAVLHVAFGPTAGRSPLRTT